MSIQEDLNRVDEGLRVLEDAAFALRSRLATDLDAVRLAEDVTRCREDLARLRVQVRPPSQPQATVQDVIVVPDGDYDAALWADGDLDAEGLGVPGRRAP